MRRFVAAGLPAMLAVGFCLGCGGGGSGRVEVEGTVTYNGQPLPAGTIEFVRGPDVKGPGGHGDISAGKYHIPEKFGPPPGQFKVRISWMKAVGPASKEGEGAGSSPVAEVLPAKYNEDTELTAELKPGKNVVNFDLKK